ncbi:MAG: heparinase II/III family protein [Bacteroidales bacterium]
MKRVLITILLLAVCFGLKAAEHPSLMLTKKGVEQIRSGSGKYQLFDSTLADTKAKADAAVNSPIVVPVPRDGGGGATHEKHKDNYYSMYYCGIMYQISGDVKYARFVEKMLDEYLKLYPTLGYHPVKMSSTPGKLFWQTLNDFVWLVHTSVAYDCVYDFLPKEKQKEYNERLFKPMAAFIMDGSEVNNKTFNKMHNHATWACTAVGMIGYVMNDNDLIQKALFGSDKTGKNGGYIKQLNELFSPDGYFTEGAYYQRYAIWPFVIFAQAINNNEPQRDIFNYRNSILKKAVNTLAQMTYEGVFFKINDALQKGFSAQELVFAVNILYAADNSQKHLLTISKKYQTFFLPTDAGFAVARDISKGQCEPFILKSQLLKDGPDGKQGGLAIFRSPKSGENATFLMKATSHGLSHGHYDKLTISYYDDGNPVLVDYGSSRFLNIVVKYNGGYTPLNDSYSMSTIAHNTVSADDKSHYDGDIKVSSRYSPSIYCYDTSNPEIQVTSAIEQNAISGVKMQRTNVFIEGLGDKRVILDIFKLTGNTTHSYYLPFYYDGDMISLSVPYSKALNKMETFGENNGHQYLWKEARAISSEPFVTFTWLKGRRFYSLTTLTDNNSELFFVRTGANDPDYYLRSDPGFIIKQNNCLNHTFLSAIETHGKYDLIVEKTERAVSSVKSLKILEDTENHTLVEIETEKGKARFRIDYNKAEGERKWSYNKL